MPKAFNFGSSLITSMTRSSSMHWSEDVNLTRAIRTVSTRGSWVVSVRLDKLPNGSSTHYSWAVVLVNLLKFLMHLEERRKKLLIVFSNDTMVSRSYERKFFLETRNAGILLGWTVVKSRYLEKVSGIGNILQCLDT